MPTKQKEEKPLWTSPNSNIIIQGVTSIILGYTGGFVANSTAVLLREGIITPKEVGVVVGIAISAGFFGWLRTNKTIY